ncbi:glycosyltransferase [Fusobacterium varium]|uniref:glycosyltransferase n=1 Tax=Fusobacterium varium TaxID=856 RepID=UPI001F1ADE1A|nr:glycosyltransferase family 2 protein [Fusobacterium varium]MCF2673215.1 glycosyltransferase family 2 protein [Fusobacterium varium]
MKIIMMISTYNRKEILEKSISSLKKVKNLEKFEIQIYDDKSSEYNEQYLKEKIPFAKKITIRNENLKADKNMYMMYKDFLETEGDYLLQADSDMIYNEEFLSIIQKIAKLKEKAVYSLYNSNLHNFFQDIEEKYIDKIEFRRKIDIGGACVLFSREIIEEIINNIKIKNEDFTSYDYRWSEYLNSKNIPIYVSKISFIQHLGIGGQNNKKIANIDLGRGFIPSNKEDITILLEYYEKIIFDTKEYYENIGWLISIKNKLKKIKIVKMLYIKLKKFKTII